MNIRHWTPFEGRPYGSKRHAARVTLNKAKIMTFNRQAYEALGQPAAVKLFFDKNLNLIGVRPEPPESECAFPMIKRGDFPYRYLRTSAFCGHFGIKPEGTVAFFDVTVDGEGMMTLELASATRLKKGAG